MISNVKYLSFILLLVLTACKSGPAASQEQNGKQDTVKVFNLPDIPVVLNTVSQRADYIGIALTLQTPPTSVRSTLPNRLGWIIAICWNMCPCPTRKLP